MEELLKRMRLTEKARCCQNEEYNGIYGILESWHTNMQTQKHDIDYYKYHLEGAVFGLCAAHFITFKEFEQLTKEINETYRTCLRKLFDTEKGKSL